MKSALLVYVAVIVSIPDVNDDVVSVATPPLRAAVPNTLVPDLKVTDPAGIPEVDDVTVAVNVTGCPVDDGFCDDVSAVLVAAFAITSEAGDDVLAEFIASPLYTAVIKCVPALRISVVTVATPALRDAVPSVALPYLNVTVPVGA